ncbi:MAG TPA: hypothetical protein VFS67_28600 [Polyangiaceae bacterium]|jgi:hypothetical protein|nr:hypothetical protein [Polyangiaceae bacterium]
MASFCVLRRRALLPALLLGCSESAAGSPAPPELELHPGYPAATSRLATSLGGNLQKSCHATLVAPGWALTAAHCFSGVEPDARGTLPDFARGFSVADVEIYPGAHVSGETRVGSGWQRADFQPAHDLALVPLRPALILVSPVSVWRPTEGCDLGAAVGLVGELGLAGDDGQGWTAQASFLGSVAAASLLGPSYAGELVAARGPAVGPGDSGSGMTASWDDLQPAAPDCALLDEPGGRSVLVGVVQDANPADPSAAFGLVPVYGPEHARWVQSKLDLPPTTADSQPPVLPP